MWKQEHEGQTAAAAPLGAIRMGGRLQQQSRLNRNPTEQMRPVWRAGKGSRPPWRALP